MDRFLVQCIWLAMTISVLVTCGREGGRLTLLPGDTANSQDISTLEEAWNRQNDPAILEDQFKAEFSALPLEGEVQQRPWADSYWPNKEGGIAKRWNSNLAADANTYTYKLHTAEEVKNLSQRELERLSPAEKYDIFTGNYEYTLVKNERSRTSPHEPTWFGLCHGWAAAAINYKEPKPVILTGANDVQVPFGSSDVKALLSFAQQYRRPLNSTRLLGIRCNNDLITDRHSIPPECREDANAGSFHLVLANAIGLRKQPFIADMMRNFQVWNHPIFSYKSRVVKESDEVYTSAAPGTVRIAEMETRMNYVTETQAMWRPLLNNQFVDQTVSRTLRYKLELDNDGKIIGGEWIDREYPDFLWLQTPPEFNGYFAKLAQIYEASIQ